MKIISHNSLRLPLKLILLTALSIPSGVYAEHKIIYTGVAGNRAIININGSNKILSRGQTSKDGVKLLSFNRNEVIIRVHGKRYRYEKKSKTGIQIVDKITIPYTFLPINLALLNKGSQRRKKKKHIKLTNFGSKGYYIDGFINGKPVGFQVDTGASDVVLHLELARHLKLKLGKSNSAAITAGGEVKAYNITLNSVRVGDIEIKNVDAFVVPNIKKEIFYGTSKRDFYVITALLGMSFLEDLKISQSEEGMTLEYMPP